MITVILKTQMAVEKRQYRITCGTVFLSPQYVLDEVVIKTEVSVLPLKRVYYIIKREYVTGVVFENISDFG